MIVAAGVTFDWTITLGNLVSAAAIVMGFWGASLRLTQRLSRFEATVEDHTNAISTHARKHERQDELLRDLMGDVQRLIGRLDSMTERRRFPREES